ncbi:MAG: hypothetical protein JXR69_00835 [Candidatus Delongbacteria bacterium]|nr:hypothetical protein [Candidatus Delongbacteria bacterium]
MRASIIGILVGVFLLQAKIGDWSTYCSISRGNDIISANNMIYVATDGGLIEYDGSESNIYDTDNGLFKINTTTVCVDFKNVVWAGHSDCTISLFDQNGRGIGALSDIEEYGTYFLNRLYSSQNYIYVAGDKLLVRYTYNDAFEKYIVTDSNLMTGNVSDVIVSGSGGDEYIYIATDTGVYMIQEESTNISYMNNWSLVSGFDASTHINKFLEIGNVVVALTTNGIYTIDGSSVVKETLADSLDIMWGQIYNNEFYYLQNSTDQIIYKSDISLLSAPDEIYRTTDQIAERFYIENDIIYYTSRSGFSFTAITGGIPTDQEFNLPAEKGIKKIIVTQDNKLQYLTSFGFRSFDMIYEEFNDEYYTESRIWQAKNFIEDNNGNVYICTWTTGVAKFSKETDGYDFDQRYIFNGPLFAKYPTHPGVCKDNNGDLWFTNYYNTDLDSTIVKISTNGTITPYKYSITDGVPPSPFEIFVDNRNWLWIGSSSEQFNERDGLTVGRILGDSLDIKNFTGLGGIISINQDKNNFVWIGTNAGIKYIDLNYLDIDRPSDLESYNISSIVEGPVGNMIYDIEISDVDEKWFATDKGVSVLSSDNTEWRHFVPASYKDDGRLEGKIVYGSLPDNTVTDIVLSSENETAIFSSYNGITFYEDESLVDKEELQSDEIATIPSPFLNDGTSLVHFIFPDNTYNSAKIFSLNGKLIKGGTGNSVFSTSGGWNGRDNNGEIVSSGIYQIVAYNDEDPTKKIIGKIAIVRK